MSRGAFTARRFAALRDSRIVPFVVGTLTVLGALLPLLVQGQNAVVRIHDHLDSIFAYAAVIARDGLIFASGTTIVPEIMGGLKRWYFESPLSIYLWLFAVLPPFKAMVANELLLRTVAFVGVYKFMRDDVMTGPDGKWPALLAAICFACNPFFPTAQASVAGVPLAAWSAQRVRHEGFSLRAVAVLAFFVLYSWLVLSGVFFLASVGLTAFYDLTRRRRGPALRLLAYAALGALFYIIREHQLFLAVLSPQAEVVQRVEMRTPTGTISGAVQSFLGVLWGGQHHAATLAAPFMFAATGAALLLAYRRRRDREVRRPAAFLIPMLGAAVATSLLYAIWRLPAVQAVVVGLHLPNFDISRFHFLQPAIWAIAFGAAMAILWREGRYGRIAAIALAVLQAGWATAHLPWYGKPIWAQNESYRAYLAPRLFDQIRKDVDAKTAMVGNVGLEPAVAQFNGFRTLDAYMVVYPLARKREIGRIIDDELDKSAQLRAAFEESSNRAYLISAQLPCMIACTAPTDADALDLNYNMAAFAAAGGTHIFSSRPIANHAELSLRLVGHYGDPDGGAMQVYAYEYSAPPAGATAAARQVP